MAHELISIMLVEDHQLVRQGMSMLINSQDDMDVVYECACVNEAKQFLQHTPSEVDVAIVDISLDGVSGFELMKWMRIYHSDLPTIAISMHDELLYAERAIKTGASGYIMKQEASDKVINGIRAVVGGEIVVSDAIRSRINSNESADRDSVIDNLTACEYEVFQLLAQGKSTSEIAYLNSRSVKTIEAHRANIRKKLGLSDGNALMRYAIKMQSEIAAV
jgi:DNA-binding NarL/FixJ family response regulator